MRLSSAGTARYTLELAEALTALGDVDVVTLGDGGAVPRQSSVQRYATVLSHDLAWYPLRGRRAALAAAADVYHVPITRGPFTRGSVPTVITVHDLVSFRHPETMSTWNRHYTQTVLGRVARAADAVTCVSQDTADDVLALLGVSQDRIHVVHNGVAAFWFDSTELLGESDPPYILFVGTPEPRKNLARLLRAVIQLRVRGRSERLVMVGGQGWGSDVLPADGSVTTTGRVTDAELRALYANAACVALPSLHEGFGLPALEAMAAGAPVVVSRAGALPEVCGSAAVYVDPLDVTSIADGLEIALAGAAPSRERRVARARSFSWESAAASMAGVYRKLL
ncbi:MAG: glycosyltransferase family 4 protein [Gemmatimonadaceae bacterium]